MIVSPVAAQERSGLRRYSQTPPVLARYPDVAITLDTPALQVGRATFTSQAEMEAFVAKLTTKPKSSQHLTQLTLGTTPGGRSVLALMLSHEGAQTPAALSQLGRPVVWLIGQQHGNEPAGGEAMLALASALADGELTPLLSKLSVVIIPRANPDGAAADSRENAGGQDLNRDHVLFSQPETKLLHGLVRQLPPALVVDAHEFTVGRRWVEKLGGLQAVDLMLLSSTHPMTPEPVRKLADNVFQPAIEAAIAPHNLSWFVYHTTSSRAGDRTISVGGNAPGIARNAFGLMGAVSFLLETRGVGIGLDSYQRRVATHYIAIKALLNAAATHAETLAILPATVAADEAAARRDIVVSHTVARSFALLPLIDPVTGADKSAAIHLLDTRFVTGTEGRTRAAGYVIAANRFNAVKQQLELLGVKVCNFSRSAVTQVERYEVLSTPAADNRAINPEAGLRVRVSSERETIAAGSVFVGIDNPAGIRLQLALEPDAPGSLSALALPGDDAGTMAIKRVPVEGMAALDGAIFCPVSPATAP